MIYVEEMTEKIRTAKTLKSAECITYQIIADIKRACLVAIMDNVSFLQNTWDNYAKIMNMLDKIEIKSEQK